MKNGLATIPRRPGTRYDEKRWWWGRPKVEEVGGEGGRWWWRLVAEEADGGGGQQWWALKKSDNSDAERGRTYDLMKNGLAAIPREPDSPGRGQGGRDESERERVGESKREREWVRASERDRGREGRERDRERPRESKRGRATERGTAAERGNSVGERKTAPGPRLRSEPHGTSRGATSHPETRCRAPITSEPRCRCLAHSRTARGCPVPSRYPLSPLSSPTIAGCPPYRHRPFR